MKILLSAFACDPSKGSEPTNGWNWAIGLAEKGYDVHCLTRIVGQHEIEKMEKYKNLKFHYIKLPFVENWLYESSTMGMYLYYTFWQWCAYKKAKKLNQDNDFKVVHHVTWGSVQLGSFMYKLNIPFIFGPAGGGQTSPYAFKKYFLKAWSSEVKREKVSELMLKYNPACKRMLLEAHTVLVSNPETAKMVESIRNKKVISTLDAALPNDFFFDKFIKKVLINSHLKLLWTGRFLPRKGLLLLLDVMNELKNNLNITLTVVGDGEVRNDFLKKIQENQLENTVIWKGSVPYEQVKAYYETHDVFIFTSLRDSCPAQLIEAMAYSMPVITLNLHGQAVIVSDETGIKCECLNPEETIQLLKNAILTFYNSPALIEEKGRAAYLFAKEQTWDKKIDNIVKNYYPLS